MHEFVFERVWWKPWTWFPVGVTVTREGRFSKSGVALLLAHLELAAEPRNAYGIPLSEATDTANQFEYVANEAPRVDWAVKAVGERMDAYYSTNKEAPRHGHLWYVKRR